MDDGKSTGSVKAPISDQAATESRVDAVWGKMEKGVSNETLQGLLKKKPSAKKTGPKSSSSSSNWMAYLGLNSKEAPKAETSVGRDPCGDEDAKKFAAAALSAVKDAAAAASVSGRGKVEISEVRDFAGQEIEVKKLVEADSKEALEKSSRASAPTTAVDAVLEQIKKKQKLSVLDKTKKDWGEFKDDNKGMEEQLDAYKKSSDQYLDKVSFLHRTDYREFERERDARLALQAKRRPDNP